MTSQTCAPQISVGVDGWQSGGSSVRRPGSGDHRQRKFFLNQNFRYVSFHQIFASVDNIFAPMLPFEGSVHSKMKTSQNLILILNNRTA